MRIAVVVALLFAGVALAAPPKPPPSTTQAPAAATEAETAAAAAAAASESDEIPDLGPQNYPAPQIDWGKCPQLQPSDADKEQKRVVIQKCLEDNPPPAVETITDPKQIDTHREVVTTCALKKEGWFNDDGSYKFDKAKAEIQSKSLDKEVEKNISKRHEECQEEAAQRYPKGYIEQVQLYQACMDYHIAEICEIELITHPDFPAEMYLDEDVSSEEILKQFIPEELAEADDKAKSEKETVSAAPASVPAKPAADSQA